MINALYRNHLAQCDLQGTQILICRQPETQPRKREYNSHRKQGLAEIDRIQRVPVEAVFIHSFKKIIFY